MSDLSQQAIDYHEQLPGLVRATLADYGTSSNVVDRFRIGWDGETITIPIRSREGRIAFLEQWDPTDIGTPTSEPGFVELFGWGALLAKPETLVVAEGVHEALVFESQGLAAVSASGSGRFFKKREWATAFSSVEEVLLAYKAGERREQRRFLLSRQEALFRAQSSVPEATVVVWPESFKPDEGAFEFFAQNGRSAADFLALPRQ